MDEAILVELEGRADKYLKMLDDAREKTETVGRDIANRIESSKDRVEDSFNKMGKSTGGLNAQFDNLDKVGRKIQMTMGDFDDLSNALKSGDILRTSSAIAQITGDIGEYITKVGLASAATTVLKIGLVAGLAFAAYEGIRAITGVNEKMKEFQEESEKSKRETEKFVSTYSDATKDIISNADNMSAAMRIPASESFARDATVDVNKLEKELKQAKQEADDLNTVFNRNLNEVVVEKSKLQVEELGKKLDVARQRQEKLNDTVRKFKFPETNRELIQQINNFTNKLHENSQAIGLTGNQAEILKFKLEGATQEMLIAANALDVLNQKIQNIGKANTDAKAIIDETSDSLKFFGMTADKVKLSKLNKELEQLDEKSVEARKAYFKLLNELVTAGNKPNANIDQLKDQVEKAFEMQKKFNEEQRKFQQLMRNVEPVMMMRKEAEELKKLAEHGAELNKQFRNPFEQFESNIKDLKNLFSKNFISPDTFERAIDDAINKLDKATNSANKFKDSLKFDAVKFGSNEALDRIEEANNKMREQWEEIKRKREIRERFDLPELKDKERLESKTLDTVSKLNRIMPLTIPNIMPKPMEVIAEPRVMVSSNDANQKETIGVLKSIDETLNRINGKTVFTVGIATI